MTSGLPRSFALFGLFALCACSEPGAAPSDSAAAPDAGSGRSTRVETLVVAPTEMVERIDVTGNVAAVNDVTLSAQSSGTVTKILDLGAEVKKGQIVAQIDTTMTRASVEQAEATVAVARTQSALAEETFKRQKPLADEGVISALELENLQARLNQARAQLDQAKASAAMAREQLSHTTLTAPFSGMVEAKRVELGEQVNPGSPVIRLVDTTVVKVNAGVPERYAADLKKGTEARVEFTAYGIGRETGKIVFVGSAIDAKNRTFPVEIALENPRGTMKPEMVARVSLLRQRLGGVLVVPQSAIVRDETGTGLFLVKRTEGKAVAERRAVTVGASSEGNVVIDSGIDAGSEVIVVGQSNVTAGDRLDVARQHQSASAAVEAGSGVGGSGGSR